MAYKHNKCGCGSSCGCNDHPVHDLSCIDVQTWEETPLLLGLDSCGKLKSVEKPENELTDEDRLKLDKITIDGDGSSAAFNDGTYKPTYTKEQTDQAISEGLEDVVTYEQDNIYPRKDIVLGNGQSLDVQRVNGNRYNGITMGPDNVMRVGSTDNDTLLQSFSRPKVTTTSGGTQTNEIAYQADIEQLREDVDEIITDRLTPLEGRVDDLEERTTQNTQSISDLQESTEAAFNVVNSELNGIGERVTQNEADIESNASDIDELRQDIANREFFRGYYLTTAEVTAIPDPVSGNYAYNVESGTVWYYNGTTWYDTTTPIPDGAVQAYEAVPRMDGVGDAGATNRYARGDHQHPSDDSKADIARLNDYLPLSGNTQTDRISGDVWMSSGKRFRFTNSGNSSIGQNTETNTTELIGNGVGGIDLIAGNGKVKADGQEVVTYDSNEDIKPKNNIRLGNNQKLLGADADGVDHNLIELSRFSIIDAGSQTVPFNITSSIRPTVQLANETGSQAHGIAFINDLETTREGLQEQITENANAISVNATNIATNTSDIDSILSRLAEEENFRGYKLTTAEVTAIPNPQNGNYAYNIQSGTIWIYNGTTWADSLEPIPDGAIQASDANPLVDGEATPGASTEYSRGDHRHPTDSTRASATALSSTQNQLDLLESNYDQSFAEIQASLSALNQTTATNTGNITSLGSRVNAAEGDISTLQGQATTIGNQVNDLETNLAEVEGRVSVNELNIESLQAEVTNAEHFRGYFLTTAEITQLPATNGDYAWSAESGTIWVYDGSVPSWTNSGNPIPEEAVTFSNTPALVNGEASAGSSTQVSRWDHIHPSDPTKANASELTSITQSISELQQQTDDAVARIDDLVALEGSYESILQLKNEGRLVTGRKYIMQSYQTVYQSSDGFVLGGDQTGQDGNVYTSETWTLVMTAISTTEFDSYVQVQEHPAWTVQYDITNDTEITGHKGTITYMKDEYGNECGYDFYNVRWWRTRSELNPAWSVSNPELADGITGFYLHTFSTIDTSGMPQSAFYDSSHKVAFNKVGLRTSSEFESISGIDYYKGNVIISGNRFIRNIILYGRVNTIYTQNESYEVNINGSNNNVFAGYFRHNIISGSTNSLSAVTWIDDLNAPGNFNNNQIIATDTGMAFNSFDGAINNSISAGYIQELRVKYAAGNVIHVTGSNIINNNISDIRNCNIMLTSEMQGNEVTRMINCDINASQFIFNRIASLQNVNINANFNYNNVKASFGGNSTTRSVISIPLTVCDIYGSTTPFDMNSDNVTIDQASGIGSTTLQEKRLSRPTRSSGNIFVVRWLDPTTLQTTSTTLPNIII